MGGMRMATYLGFVIDDLKKRTGANSDAINNLTECGIRVLDIRLGLTAHIA
jgi:hypothetical protein